MNCSKAIAPQMNKRVTVQTITRTSDNQGGFTEDWTNTKQIWAKIEPIKAYEKFQTMQMATPASHRVTIRYYRNLTTANRLLYDRRIFDIKEIINLDEDNSFMRLACMENQDGT